MINYRKIKMGIFIILSMLFVANLFLYFTGGVDTGIPLTLNAIILLLPSLLLWTSRKNVVENARRIRCDNVDQNFKFLENRIGYQIIAETFMSEFQGTLVEVDKEWLKIKDRGMGSKMHLLKSNMITFIIIK